MTFSKWIAVVAVALLERALVALPKAHALEQLGRLHSPAWAAVLPGMIIVGNFGLLALPSMAPGLILLASVATPLLAALASSWSRGANAPRYCRSRSGSCSPPRSRAGGSASSPPARSPHADACRWVRR